MQKKSRDFRFEPQVLPVSIRKSFIPKDLCLQICQIEEFEPYTKFQDNRLKNTPKNRYFVSAHAQYIFFYLRIYNMYGVYIYTNSPSYMNIH